ncbi:MAG: phosphatase PAP2 family protein [Formivibrio sp.]|nr:phosphatase PAP2 family protein [Formivibrio sp.]
MGSLEALNQTFFLSINARPDTPAGVISLVIAVANDLILLIPLLLLAVWLWGDEHLRNVAIKSCVVTLIALGLNQLIGLVWQHPRPLAMGLGHTFMAHALDSSFPSDHITVFSAIGFSFLLGGLRYLGLLTLLAGFVVAWARVFLGVHFPLDMVGAVVVAGVTYFLFIPVWSVGGGWVMQAALIAYRKIFAWPISSGWVRH